MRSDRRPIARSLAAITARCALALIPLVGACDDDDPTRTPLPPALTIEDPGELCSVDPIGCDAPVQIAFTVDERFDAADANFVLELDVDADGSVDATLDPASVLSGTHPDYTIDTRLAIGTYSLRIEMTDAQATSHDATVALEVLDCRAPAPVCINGLAVELAPVAPGTDADGDGDLDAAAMTVFAADFLATSVQDCSGPVVYSIHRSGETADPDQSSLVLTCDDLGTLVVEIHAWDQALGSLGGRNHDWCETFVLVQDSMGHCAP